MVLDIYRHKKAGLPLEFGVFVALGIVVNRKLRCLLIR